MLELNSETVRCTLDGGMHIKGQLPNISNDSSLIGVHLGHHGNSNYGMEFISPADSSGVYFDFRRTNNNQDNEGRFVYEYTNDNGRFNFNKTIVAPGWSSSSDDRMKHNETPVVNALNSSSIGTSTSTVIVLETSNSSTSTSSVIIPVVAPAEHLHSYLDYLVLPPESLILNKYFSKYIFIKIIIA